MRDIQALQKEMMRKYGEGGCKFIDQRNKNRRALVFFCPTRLVIYSSDDER